MTNLQKKEIAAKLKAYVVRFNSQNQAANSLKKVSAGTISQILNENWELISDEMWKNIESQVCADEWQAVETNCLRLFIQLLSDAQANAFTYAVTAEAGSGKTFSARHYTDNNRNVFHLVCGDKWRPVAFLSELLRVMGRSSKANNNDTAAMLNEIVLTLGKMDKPLLIFDEVDKLHDSALYFLITLYNRLENYCGIVLCATPYLEKRFTDGLNTNRPGYSELYSRIGRCFIALPSNRKADVKSVCQANGVTGEDQITEIYNQSEGDMRRVRRMIHAAKLKV